MYRPCLAARCTGLLLFALVLVTSEPPAAPAADAEQAAQRAAALLKQVGVNRGLCVIIGQDTDVILELVQSSDLTVLVREPDAKARARLQQAAVEAGLGIDRLVIQSG